MLGTAALDLERRALLIEQIERPLSFRCRVDLVDLRTAPPVLATQIARDGVAIVDRDPEVRFDFEIDAIRRFEDTRPLRRVQHELLREVARGRA